MSIYELPPIEYIPQYVMPFNNVEVDTFWNELPLFRIDKIPRYECWMNDLDMDYTYGGGIHARTYKTSPWNPLVKFYMDKMNEEFGTKYNCCFINGYPDEKFHLGWHSDDSPEMDDEHPIAVLSIGGARELWFRPTEERKEVHKKLLENCSLLIMNAGMQLDWEHRIPKAGRPCAKRLSLTFRRIVDV